MAETITIAPLTRIEGHASITIRLDDDGRVADARLHVREFRGFEAFCVGRPFWEMPAITARVCGICPVSHALAAAAAGEAIFGIRVPPAARLRRSLLTLAQLVLSHSLSFFHLSGPDIVLGLSSAPAERNLSGMARRNPEFARKGIRLRRIAQEIVNHLAGGHLHPEQLVVGGMRHPLEERDREAVALLLPEAMELVHYGLDVWHGHRSRFMEEFGDCCREDALNLGLVGDDGCIAHGGGRLRFVGGSGVTVAELEPPRYGDALRETEAGDSYMKATEYIAESACGSLYRVGPLSRINAAPFAGAPLANRERHRLLNGEPAVSDTRLYHHARLVEMLYAVESMGALLPDPLLLDDEVLATAGVNFREGVGVVEAPRGTLIHHYRVDRHGLLTGVNLIVATAHNSRAMDRTIAAIARHHLTGGTLDEAVLNRIEHGIRLYDPCLSCATHSAGRRGLPVELLAPDGKLLDRAWL